MLSPRPRRLGNTLMVGAVALALALATQPQVSTPRDNAVTEAQGKIALSAATTCGAMAKYAPRCGTLWGVYTLQNGNPEQSVRRLETEVGRKFDLTLRYHDFSDHQHQGNFPDYYERRLGADHTLFLSWQARVSDTNRNISWRAIANGYYDRFINRAATQVKAHARPVFIAFDPEFDTHTTKGTMADYVAAYRRVVNKFRGYGVTNVAWAWVSSGYLGAGNDAKIQAGYPGDSYVDWVGWDPFNFYRCNGTTWKTFGPKVTPTYNWMKANGHGDKPFLLSEYGTQYGSSTLTKQWYDGIPGALRSLPNLKAMVRFDSNGTFRSTKCGFYIKNGYGALPAFAQAGKAVQAGLVR